VRVKGSSIDGEVVFPKPDERGEPIVITLDTLRLGRIDGDPDTQDRYDPRRFPALKFSARNLIYDAVNIGTIKFSTSPQADGLSVDTFLLLADGFEASSTGAWTLLDGEHHSQFVIEVHADKLDRLLRTQLTDKQMLLGSEKLREKRYLGTDSFAWLAIINIDHFKSINSTYGHLFGDEVILAVSQKMREEFRTSDLLFHFGRQEFVVVLEPTVRSMVQRTLARFCETIADYKFSQEGQVTVSIGYTLLTDKTYPSRVLAQADQALYYAKQHGRNCVYDYAVLLRAGNITRINVAD